uniref:FXYD domain-containing ion transport regulator n=1 Tax=Denticeps clupeoides TaxID=299321 RepID=A0AAY4CCH0_9TELE
MSSKEGKSNFIISAFVTDYHTLRVGGLVFAGIIVFLSIILLAGNKICKCGKANVSPSSFSF